MRPTVALLAAAVWTAPQTDDRGVLLDPNTLRYLAPPEEPVTIPSAHCPPDRTLVIAVPKLGEPAVGKCLPSVLLSDPEQ